jgi:hypothetical protein
MLHQVNQLSISPDASLSKEELLALLQQEQEQAYYE